MKTIILFILLTSLTFGQSELILLADDEPVYALDLNGSGEYLYDLETNHLNIDGGDRLWSSDGWLASTEDWTEGHWIFDSLYNTHNEEFEIFTGTADDGAEDAFTGWSELQDARSVIEAVTTDPHTGIYCLKSTSSNASPNYIVRYLAITPYDSLKFSFWMKGSVTGTGNEGYYSIGYVDNGVYVDIKALTAVQPTNNVWTNYTYTFRLGNYDTVAVLITPCKGVGSVSYLDDVTLIRYYQQDLALKNNLVTDDGSGITYEDFHTPFNSSGALHFDGTDYLYIPASADSFEVGSSDFSIEAWINFSDNQTNDRGYIVSKHLSSGDSSYQFYVTGTGHINVKLSGAGGSTSTNTTSTYNDGRWHYVAVIVDLGTNIKIFVDGRQANITTNCTVTNISTTSADFMIGAIERVVSAWDYEGYIAEVKFSKRLLTSTEIINNYHRESESGFNDEWVDNGNHTVDSTSTAAQSGTYSGKIISSGVGDNSANYISFVLSEPLTSGYKYLLEFYAKTLYNNAETITAEIGDISYTYDPTTSFARGYKHFKATGSTGSTLKIFLNQQDTVLIDYIRVVRLYDMAIMAWINKTSETEQYIIKNGSSNGTWGLFTSTANRTSSYLRDDLGTAVQVNYNSTAYNDGEWHLVGSVINWTYDTDVSGLTTYFDTGSIVTTISALSSIINNTDRLRIGSTGTFNGYLGGIRVYKFDDINDSDINFTTMYNSGTLKIITGGGAMLIGDWNWDGDATTLDDDKSTSGNDLTGSGVDITDQVQVGTTYK